MSAADEILSQLPINQLAAQLGVDEQTAEAAARQALPALLLGMDANAQDPARAASLEKAIGEHDSALVDGGVDLADVDAADGEKIVGHVFGDNSDQVMHALGGSTGVGGSLMGKLLPILAPIVLAYLSKRLGAARGGAQAAGGDAGGSLAGPGDASAGASSGGLGDILGQILGAAGGGGQAGQGDPIGDLLGGLLGGGRR